MDTLALPDPDWEHIAGLLYDALEATLRGNTILEHEQEALDAFLFAKFQTGNLAWGDDL